MLPASLSDIEPGAFEGAYLRKITVAEGNGKYKALAIDDGTNGYALYEKYNDTDDISSEDIPLKLIRYCRPQFRSTDAYVYAVPDNVKVIGPYIPSDGQG